jgi:hypothetical protein
MIGSNKVKKVALGLSCSLIFGQCQASTCSPSGFYVGVGIAAQFQKWKVSVDKDKLAQQATSSWQELIHKLRKSENEIKKVEQGLQKIIPALNEYIIRILSDLRTLRIGGEALVDRFAGSPEAPGNSILSLALGAPVFAAVEASQLRIIMQELVKADPSLKEQEAMRVAIEAVPFVQIDFTTALTNLYANPAGWAAVTGTLGNLRGGANGNYLEAGGGQAAMVGTPEILASIDPEYLNHAASLGVSYQAAIQSHTTMLTTIYTPKPESDLDPRIKAAFFQDQAQERIVSASVIGTNLQQFSQDRTNEQLEELGFTSNQVSKTPTSAEGSIQLGGTIPLCERAIFGIEASFHYPIGGTATIGEDSESGKTTLKKGISGQLLTSIGFRASPKLLLSLIAGVDVGRYKGDTTALGKASTEARQLAENYNSTPQGKKDPIDIEAHDAKQSSALQIYRQHHKTVLAPVIGGALELAVKRGFCVQLSYKFMPSTTIFTEEKQGAKVRYQSHSVGLAIKKYFNG